MRQEELYLKRRQHCETKLDLLRHRIDGMKSLKAFPNLCIFAAGSYGRLEASEHSDIDLFFLNHDLDQQNSPKLSHLSTIELMSEVIQTVSELKFPKLSNDGQFLKILSLNDNRREMGGYLDDYNNHFTARMLMLLESRSLNGDERFTAARDVLLESYFRDYEDHAATFQPIFLVNDIVRFWKTLCLNYEHKRNQRTDDVEVKTKQKIKNFKLKFSRMLTCYGTLILLCAHKRPVKPENAPDIFNLTPLDRLMHSVDLFPGLKEPAAKIRESYAWFLDLTGLTEQALFARFLNKDERTKAFAEADEFGSLVFTALRSVAEANGYLRYIVI